MKTYAAWGVAHNVLRGTYSVCRLVYVDGKNTDVDWMKNPNGRRRWFKSKRAAEAAALEANGK